MVGGSTVFYHSWTNQLNSWKRQCHSRHCWLMGAAAHSEIIYFMSLVSLRFAVLSNADARDTRLSTSTVGHLKTGQTEQSCMRHSGYRVLHERLQSQIPDFFIEHICQCLFLNPCHSEMPSCLDLVTILTLNEFYDLQTRFQHYLASWCGAHRQTSANEVHNNDKYLTTADADALLMFNLFMQDPVMMAHSDRCHTDYFKVLARAVWHHVSVLRAVSGVA